jgi:hypothetical protein
MILTCHNTSDNVDAVAIAPYLSITLDDSMNGTDIFTSLTAQTPILATVISTHLSYTNQYSLPLLCYESGQGLVGSTPIQTSLQISVQTFPQIRQLYFSYF